MAPTSWNKLAVMMKPPRSRACYSSASSLSMRESLQSLQFLQSLQLRDALRGKTSAVPLAVAPGFRLR